MSYLSSNTLKTIVLALISSSAFAGPISSSGGDPRSLYPHPEATRPAPPLFSCHPRMRFETGIFLTVDDYSSINPVNATGATTYELSIAEVGSNDGSHTRSSQVEAHGPAMSPTSMDAIHLTFSDGHLDVGTWVEDEDFPSGMAGDPVYIADANLSYSGAQYYLSCVRTLR